MPAFLSAFALGFFCVFIAGAAFCIIALALCASRAEADARFLRLAPDPGDPDA